MPSPKRRRDKKAEDKTQTSLFSFVDEEKEQKKTEEKPKEEEIKTEKEEKLIENKKLRLRI